MEKDSNTHNSFTDDAPSGSRALLGATFAVALLAGIALLAVASPPDAADSGAQVVAWFREHRSSARWWTWILTVNIPVSALLFAMLRRLLPAPHRDVFLIGATVYLADLSLQAWTPAGLALHADQLEPAIARTVLDISLFFGPVLTAATTTMMAPVTLLALRRKAGLPSWLGLLGAIAVVEQTIETITIFGSTGFAQPGGPMNFQLGAGLVMAWMIGFGVWGGLRGRALNLQA